MSSAYDNIVRKKVYKVISKMNILTENELKLLKFIHSNLKIQVGSKKCKTTRGTPQGVSTSPLFWNIYLNSLLVKLNSNYLRNCLCR